MAGYAGIGGTARKLKRVYVGVNGVARKIKRMYVGVNGVARLWYKAKGTLTYQGTATALSAARANLCATNTATHVLFAGGSSSSSSTGTASKVVNAYDKALTMTTPGSSLAKARENLAGASLNGKALFAGGSSYSSSSEATTAQSTVDAYDDSLTRQAPTALSTARYGLGGASVGEYVLFGGGYASGASTIVESYNTSLTKGSAADLSAGRYYIAGATHKNHALFAGGIVSSGFSGASSDAIDAYDSSLTRSTPTAMSAKAGYVSAARIGKYVIFAGGANAGFLGQLTNVDFANAYDDSLTATVLTVLPKAKRYMGAAATENYALFAGGYTSEPISAVDVYDDTLTRTTGTGLGATRTNLAGGSIGDYALFAGGGGGTKGTTAQTTVYAYKEA